MSEPTKYQSDTKNDTSYTSFKPNHLEKKILLILHNDKEQYTAKELQIKTKSTHASFFRAIRRLNSNKLIEKIKSSVTFYKLTEQGIRKYQQSIKILAQYENKRGDGIISRSSHIYFKFKILALPSSGWQPPSWTKNPMRNWMQYSRWYDDIFVLKTTQSIVMKVVDKVSLTPEETLFYAGKKVLDTREQLHQEFKGLRLSERFELIRQEHAVPNDPFAQLCNELGVSYSDDRIALDASKIIPEIEFINPEHSVDDWHKYVDEVRSIITGKAPTNSELANHIDRILTFQDKYAENIQLHLAVLQEIRDAIKEMRR